MIMNLCTNAYKAMKDSGGLLRISLKETDVLRGASHDPNDLPTGRYAALAMENHLYVTRPFWRRAPAARREARNYRPGRSLPGTSASPATGPGDQRGRARLPPVCRSERDRG